MRYILFACDEVGGHQMRSDTDLTLLKKAADNLRTKAEEDGEDLRYVIKQGYRIVYKGKVCRN